MRSNSAAFIEKFQKASAEKRAGPSSAVYKHLASIYDEIMSDVDYSVWADFLESILLLHHPVAYNLLELACGTGTMAFMLEERGEYEITGTDISPEMIQEANNKRKKKNSEVRFFTQDMRQLETGLFDNNSKYDILYMIFDSINYLHQEKEILHLFSGVKKCLKKKGFFIFDFTTPNYSPKIAAILDGEYRKEKKFQYYRKSWYDKPNSIHMNHFFVQAAIDSHGVKKDLYFEEIHRQRIWTFCEMKEIINKSDLYLVAAYEDFELKSADVKSDRITMVLAYE